MSDHRSSLLHGRVVAITGAARGIGLATAQAFHAAGAKVAIGDLDATLSEHAAGALSARGGTGRAIGLPLDVTDAGSFQTFVDQAEHSLGPVDVLINNAGIMPTGQFLDESAARTDQILDVNVRGVINGCRIVGERFSARGTGHVVNVASLAGVASYPGLATYCASKHAVVGFSAALHREWAPLGLHVTMVLPGVVRTELSAGAQIPRWAEGLTTVDPGAVAAAIVRAVCTQQTRVTVPRRLGAVLQLLGALPVGIRNRIEQATELDTAFSAAHGPAHEAYQRRIDEAAR